MTVPTKESDAEALEILANVARNNIGLNEEPTLIMKDYLRKERVRTKTLKQTKLSILNALVRLVIGVWIVIGLALIYSSASANKPDKKIMDVLDGPELMISDDFAKYMETFGHAKAFTIYDVE